MARVEGETVIGRPVDVVFNYVADQSNEPQYNPQVVRAEKITAGPVGKGTQFRSAAASRGWTSLKKHLEGVPSAPGQHRQDRTGGERTGSRPLTVDRRPADQVS